jgi:hypothetical protein
VGAWRHHERGHRGASPEPLARTPGPTPGESGEGQRGSAGWSGDAGVSSRRLSQEVAARSGAGAEAAVTPGGLRGSSRARLEKLAARRRGQRAAVKIATVTLEF